MIQTAKSREQSRNKGILGQINGGGSQEVRKPPVRETSQHSSMKDSNIRFDDVVSLTEVKDLARRLPPDSRARELMFALNDNETRWIALGQLLLIHKFLWDEFKN
jgi:hypothetical protein